MKMQLRKILIFSAVDDETIRAFGEMMFSHKALNGSVKVGEKGSVVWVNIHQGRDGFPGDDYDMKFVRGSGMVKSHQGFGLMQSFNRDNETHMSKDPTDERGEEPKCFMKHYATRNTQHGLCTAYCVLR